MKRRTFLRAAGAGASSISIGLPILDAMLDNNGLLVPKTYCPTRGSAALPLFTWFFPVSARAYEGAPDTTSMRPAPTTHCRRIYASLSRHREDLLVLGRTYKYAYEESDKCGRMQARSRAYTCSTWGLLQSDATRLARVGLPSSGWPPSTCRRTAPIRMVTATLDRERGLVRRRRRRFEPTPTPDPQTLFQRVFR